MPPRESRAVRTIFHEMSQLELSEQLRRAHEQVRELQLSRDALQSSVNSLNVLVSNERAQTRAAKRRLIASERAASEAAKLAGEVEQLRALLGEKDKELNALSNGREDGGGVYQKAGGGKVSSVIVEEVRVLEARLEKETRLRETLQNERVGLERQLATLRDTLKRREEGTPARRKNDDVERQMNQVICREQALRNQLRGKEGKVCEFQNSLQEREATAESLDEALSEILSLRSRLLEMEKELQLSARPVRLFQGKDVVAKNESQTGEGGAMQEAKIEEARKPTPVDKGKSPLRTARNVIMEKDKIIAEMPQKLPGAEADRLKMAFTSQETEQRTESVSDALAVAGLQLKQAKLELSAQGLSYVALEQRAAELADDFARAIEEREAFSRKVEEYKFTIDNQHGSRADMEKTLRKAEKDLAALKEQASAKENELNELQKEKEMHDDFRISMEERHRIAEEQRVKAVKEAQNFKDSLEACEKEVVRLEGLIAKNGMVVDDFGSSSPCSTDPGAEERDGIPLSYDESIQKLNELEEAMKLARSSYKQKCLEAQTLASSVSENATTIVTLNRALLVSRQACDEKHDKLEASIAKANGLERLVRQLRAELASRIEECDFLENRIRSELEPSLLETNTELDQRISELKITKEEFGLQKDLSEKTRLALEKEVGSLSERLHEASSILSSTQNNLTQSEQKGAELQSEIASLTDERRENCKIIGDLQSQCEYRYQALRALESQLLTVQQVVAEHEQAAYDANRERDALTRLLEQAHDKQNVAEKRASRKNEANQELTEKADELKHSYAVAQEALTKVTSELNKVKSELDEFRDVAKMKDQALRSQGDIARNREALFESLTAELRGVIASRDKTLDLAKENLQTVERRVKSLTELLEKEKERLKISQSELDISRRQFSDCQAQNRRLEVRLCEAEEECSKLLSEHDLVLEDLTARKNQISDQLSLMTEKEGKIVGLTTEKNQLEKLVLEMRDKLASEKTRSEAMEAEICTLESSLEERTSALYHCEEQLTARTTEARSLSKNFAYAQASISELENNLSGREVELESCSSTIDNLEASLGRAEQRVSVLESHLDGHDTVVKDCSEKEEALAVKSQEMRQAAEYIAELEKSIEGVRQQLATAEAEVGTLSGKASSFERKQAALESELTKAQDARVAVENSLHCTSATLDALEASSSTEIDELKRNVASLQKMNDEHQSAHSDCQDATPQTFLQADLVDRQMAELRTKNGCLKEKLFSVESELASKRNILAELELKAQHTDELLKKREDEVERLERNLVDRSQALSFVRSKVEDLTNKTANTGKDEVLAWQSKLDSKEKAIANLHNWCCFINGKLHTAEKALEDREMVLEASSAALKKIEAQLEELNEFLEGKGKQILGLESPPVVEVSELKRRIQSLQSYLDEASSEREKQTGNTVE